ncbi:MAG TPA: hypothetical protein VNB06_16050 [Thermoanaerobaculia bacterium]|nr:hypothetical protein [Thermoanaerobaculia bacterium]
MVYSRQGRTPIGLGSGPPAPSDVWILLAIVFGTFSAQFFTTALEWLRLTPAVWQRLLVWQAATYPWIGVGGASLWILLELLILFWFAGAVRRSLGRGRFWRLLLYVTIGAGLAAIGVDVAMALLGVDSPSDFLLMQGQRMLVTVLVAAFAVLHRNATILLFFVLPIQARWFLWLELLIAFIGFLGTKDLPGFLGICAAVGLTVALLQPDVWRGGPFRGLRQRWDRFRVQRRLGHRRRKAGLRLVRPGAKGEPPSGGWIH